MPSMGGVPAARAQSGLPAARAQRAADHSNVLAAAGLLVLVLVGVPVAVIRPAPRQPDVPFSFMDCCALSLIDLSPRLKPTAAQLLAPTSLFKHMAATLRRCANGDQEACRVPSFFQLHQEDMRAKLALFKQAFTTPQLHALFAGSWAVVLGALACMYRPVRASFLGFLLFAFGIFAAATAAHLPTLWLLGFLGGWVLLDVENIKLPRLFRRRRQLQQRGTGAGSSRASMPRTAKAKGT